MYGLFYFCWFPEQLSVACGEGATQAPRWSGQFFLWDKRKCTIWLSLRILKCSRMPLKFCSNSQLTRPYKNGLLRQISHTLHPRIYVTLCHKSHWLLEIISLKIMWQIGHRLCHWVLQMWFSRNSTIKWVYTKLPGTQDRVFIHAVVIHSDLPNGRNLCSFIQAIHVPSPLDNPLFNTPLCILTLNTDINKVQSTQKTNHARPGRLLVNECLSTRSSINVLISVVREGKNN